MYGYTVGKTNGWNQAKRESFLSDFIEMDLPALVALHFDNEYATPLSASRLCKVANVIASNANSFYRNAPQAKRICYRGLGIRFSIFEDKILRGQKIKISAMAQHSLIVSA